LPSPDEVEYVGGKTAGKVIIGGAGSYAAIGARLAAGERYARSVSWIVDVGSDFPPERIELVLLRELGTAIPGRMNIEVGRLL
jgi:hypothetical protein